MRPYLRARFACEPKILLACFTSDLCHRVATLTRFDRAIANGLSRRMGLAHATPRAAHNATRPKRPLLTQPRFAGLVIAEGDRTRLARVLKPHFGSVRSRISAEKTKSTWLATAMTTPSERNDPIPGAAALTQPGALRRH